jgi:hypothetical protein
MNYLNLSSIQKVDIGITSLLFCLFMTIIRPLIIDSSINSRIIIAYTLIFFATMGLTTIFTNSLSFNNLFYKININNKE